MSGAILRVEKLRVAYDHPRGAVRAVDEVSFSRIRFRQVDDSARSPAHD
jgi:ABC-type dipeptide/oligopeptide/nickel transport system ATPase component